MKLRFPLKCLKKKDKHPLLIRNEQFFSGFDLSQPVESYDFVAFDTELTGLNPGSDEIVSIAGLRIRDLQIVVNDCFYSYVRPKIEKHTTATFLHRITPEELKNSPSPGVALEAFIDFCGNSVLVGHHVYIDMSFLWKAMTKTMRGVIKNPVIDSMQLAMCYRNNRKVAPGYQDILDARSDHAYSLAALSKEYRLPIFPQHDALQDALQTAYLFIFLVTNLLGDKMETLEQFYRAGFPPRFWL
ncbi:MAG: 3'-5' exonuclease [Deltaproteobacteria bacterium]|nr:3'-5' exonuclease [Deltaproteobacteria bacterium]